MFKLTDKNKKILEVLKENSKLSTSKISKKTGIPITTVHNRIKKMEKEGVIEKYTVVLDDKKLGRNILALIFASVSYKQLKSKQKDPAEKLRRLSNYSCVESIFEITGKYDLVIKVRTKDIEELNSFINEIQGGNYGINKTETMVVINEISS